MISIEMVKDWLGVDTLTLEQQTALEALQARAQETIERELDWYFGAPRPCIEIRDGNAKDRLFLHQPPVTGEDITVETRTGVGVEDWELLDTDFWELSGRTLFHSYAWPWGRRNIRVSYTEGFPTPPGDIVQLLLDLISSKVLVDSGELQSETIGDYSYTRKDLEEQSSWPRAYNNWKRGRI